MGTDAPLTALLSWVWIAWAIEADNAFEAVGLARPVGRLFRISLPMWANGLRLIDEDGVPLAEVQRRARAVCNVPGLERWGWVRIGSEAVERRRGYGTQTGLAAGCLLRPTRAGTWARRLWPQILDTVEGRWRERFGGSVVDELAAAAATLARPLSWAPPEVHPSDGFRTHVIGEDPGPEHPPTVALLAQALTTLTVEHESRTRASLPTAANFLRVLDAAAVLQRNLPARTGLSKEGVAMGVAHLRRRGLAEQATDRTLSLTAAGRALAGEYRAVATDLRHPRLRAALEAITARPELLAAGLVPPPGCWRGEPPYRTAAARVLADPISALPWQPMVLHRGGWPDAC